MIPAKEGVQYWYVADIRQKYEAIPVTLEGDYAKWHLGNGIFEYYRVYRHNIYRTQQEAQEAAGRQNREAEQWREKLKK